MNQDSELDSDLPNIGRVARRTLFAAGYYRMEQLTHVSEKELLCLHGMGPKAIDILRRALAEQGLSFAEPT